MGSEGLGEHGTDPRRVVVVGAGHGGATVAVLLRTEGYSGEIVVFDADGDEPYHRPPLSKGLLRPSMHERLHPEGFYASHDIALRLGERVTAIDLAGSSIAVAGGERIGYDALVLAAGANPRAFEVPGATLGGVHTLRSLRDAQRLSAALEDPETNRLLVVGGGWIGLEVAASARAAGIEVVVVEREERVLARVASPELSEYVSRAHLATGTELVLGAQVAAFEGTSGALEGLLLADGRRIAGQAAIVAVGAVPEVTLARDAGIVCEDGVVVDADARTSDPMVYAVGDVTARPLARHGGLFRLESIPSATEQARQVVAAILGQPRPRSQAPWFWSDQLGLRVRIAGMRNDTDRAVLRRFGDDDALAVFHLRSDRLLGLECVNAPSVFRAGRRLVADEARVDVERLADPDVELDDLRLDAAPEPAPAQAAAAPEPSAGASTPEGPWRATFVVPSGDPVEVPVPAGLSLMEAAKQADVDGILGDCGGTASCGTCHCYVDDAWRERVGPATELELEMLDYLAEPRPESRLTCQIQGRYELDGVVLRVVEE